MWVSPQSFNAAWMDEFFGILKTEPAWLSRRRLRPAESASSLPELRAAVPQAVPDPPLSRHHAQPAVRSIRCPTGTSAYAVTEGREVDQPAAARRGQHLPRCSSRYTIGFLTYSEGCNDDVNKFVWSALGWDPDADVDRDPARVQPLLHRRAIRRQLRAGAAGAGAELARAAAGERRRRHDAAAVSGDGARRRRRRCWRTGGSSRRCTAPTTTPTCAAACCTRPSWRTARWASWGRRSGPGRWPRWTRAEAILDRDDRARASPRLAGAGLRAGRGAVPEHPDAVERACATRRSPSDRGANLDAIDCGLNNRVWLKARFAEIRGDRRSKRSGWQDFDAIVNWTDPGPGGFYDDLGESHASSRTWCRAMASRRTPSSAHSSLIGFGSRRPDQGWRVPGTARRVAGRCAAANALHGSRPERAIQNSRRVRRRQLRVPVRLVANGNVEMHRYRQKPAPVAAGGVRQCLGRRPRKGTLDSGVDPSGGTRAATAAAARSRKSG